MVTITKQLSKKNQVCSFLNTMVGLLKNHCYNDAKDISPEAAIFLTRAIIEIDRAETLLRLTNDPKPISSYELGNK